MEPSPIAVVASRAALAALGLAGSVVLAASVLNDSTAAYYAPVGASLGLLIAIASVVEVVGKRRAWSSNRVLGFTLAAGTPATLLGLTQGLYAMGVLGAFSESGVRGGLLLLGVLDWSIGRVLFIYALECTVPMAALTCLRTYGARLWVQVGITGAAAAGTIAIGENIAPWREALYACPVFIALALPLLARFVDYAAIRYASRTRDET